jgi:hypothetical protein
MIFETIAALAVLDEIESQNQPRRPLPYKRRTPRDDCYHGAWNWRDCGECSKLGRKVMTHEDAVANTNI